MVTTTDEKTEWIEVQEYRGYLIQRTYSDTPYPYRVETLSGIWQPKRTLPDCQRFIDEVIDEEGEPYFISLTGWL